MSKIIYKYKLHTYSSSTILELPVGSRILACNEQTGDLGIKELMLWCEIETGAPTETREFIIQGTGWEYTIPEEVHYKHIDTVVTQEDEYVWHVFEVVKK